jgi:exosome complex component RRP4
MVLTMKGIGLRRLNEGCVIAIPVNLIDTLRGDNNSRVSKIRDLTDCRVIVADNGRVWVHGDADNMFTARELIQTLVDEGHMNNFEDAVHALEQQRGEN